MVNKAINVEKKRMATKTMVVLAMMSAVSIILSRFCVIYFTDQLRLSFGNVPIFIVGFLYGPAAGVLVGGVTDFIGSAVLSGYGWYPPLTVTPVIIGLMAGLLRGFVMSNLRLYRVIIVTLLTNALSTISWSTACLSWLYGTTFLTNLSIRLPFYLLVAVLEGIVLFALFKSGAFKKVLCDRK